MSFKISNSFFYTQKWPVLFLRIPVLHSKQVILIRSTSTFLRTLYRRPNPIKIWPTYVVRPTTTLYTRSTYDLWRAGSSPTIFHPVEKLIPLTTTSQSGSDQPPLLFQTNKRSLRSRSAHCRSIHFSRAVVYRLSVAFRHLRQEPQK